jgi:hypothetical protein
MPAATPLAEIGIDQVEMAQHAGAYRHGLDLAELEAERAHDVGLLGGVIER